MNNIQSLLTIGAIALFSLISIRFNSSVLENMTVEVENKVYLTAFSLADDLIEEIKQKAFDEETVEFRSITPTELTPSNQFAPEIRDLGETDDPATWDDIDDYNGYSKLVSLPHAEGFSVTSQVDYVQENNYDQVSSVQTFFKRIQVRVSSDYLRAPVRLSFVFTLHSK
jgi:hypothetical protein